MQYLILRADDSARHIIIPGAPVLGSAIDKEDANITETFARFRISTAGGLSYDGLALDGEVEDYDSNRCIASD